MALLFLRAYLSLICFDLYLVRGNFAALYQRVRSCPVASRTMTTDAVERVCSAVDMACICYWKEVRCLQRSAACTCLLKNFGVTAQLVIGAQQLPFKAHAWVEVECCVVNDKPYMKDIYAVLDRC